MLNIDSQMKKEFDNNNDKSILSRDKWYKEKRSNGKIVNEKGSSKLCYGLETDFIKVCNKYVLRKDVLPLKEIKFENHVFQCPNNAEKMLEMIFDDYRQWPNDAGSSVHGANRRYSRYKNYDNPWYIHTRNEAEIFCKQMDKQYKDYQLIIEKYKIADWKDYFDIVDYLDDNNINYIVYA